MISIFFPISPEYFSDVEHTQYFFALSQFYRPNPKIFDEMIIGTGIGQIYQVIGLRCTIPVCFASRFSKSK